MPSPPVGGRGQSTAPLPGDLLGGGRVRPANDEGSRRTMPPPLPHRSAPPPPRLAIGENDAATAASTTATADSSSPAISRRAEHLPR